MVYSHRMKNRIRLFQLRFVILLLFVLPIGNHAQDGGGEEAVEVPKTPWQIALDAACSVIESDLNDPSVARSGYFNLHQSPWYCSCFNSSSFDVDFGDGVSLCTTGLDICASVGNEDDNDFTFFEGTTTVSDVFNFSNINNNQKFNGAFSNTPVGYFSQRCFEYSNGLFGNSNVCLNYDEVESECGIQVNGIRCTFCKWCGEYKIEADCREINPNLYANSCDGSSNLVGTFMQFYDESIAVNYQCFVTEPPELTPGEQFENDLNNDDTDTINTEPWVCQFLNDYDENFISSDNVLSDGTILVAETTSALCTTGEVVCVNEDVLDESGTIIDTYLPFSGVYSKRNTYDVITEDVLATYNCFNYVNLYNSAEVCFGTYLDSSNTVRCTASINGERCQTCDFCGDNFLGLFIDCTNLIDTTPGGSSGDTGFVPQDYIIDQCNPDENGFVVALQVTIIRYLTTNIKRIDDSRCTTNIIRNDIPYQGVWKMSNQLNNMLSVYRIGDDGYLTAVGDISTRGIGYPGTTTGEGNRLDYLGSSNPVLYHEFDGRQWVISVNAGGPNNEPSVTATAFYRDLSPMFFRDVEPQKSGVRVPLRGIYPCSVAAYDDRVCVLGCGGTLTVECFELMRADGSLRIEQFFDFNVSISESYFQRPNVYGVNMEGGSSIKFSPNGEFLALLFKGSFNSTTFQRIDPSGLYFIKTVKRSPQGLNFPYGHEYIFYEQPIDRSPCSFTWSDDSKSVFVLNSMGGVDEAAILASQQGQQQTAPTQSPGPPTYPRSSLSIIRLSTDVNGNTQIKETGWFSINAYQACWITFSNDYLYTGNYNNYGDGGTITTIGLKTENDLEDATQKVVVPKNNGIETRLPIGLTVLDLVVSGEKLRTGKRFLYVDCQGDNVNNVNKIATYEISNDDGSIELLSFIPYNTNWLRSAGITVTTLSEEDLRDKYPEPIVVVPTPPPPPPPPTPAPTRISGCISNNSNIFNIQRLSTCLIIIIISGGF